jgi:hypothetical protein
LTRYWDQMFGNGIYVFTSIRVTGGVQQTFPCK